MKLVRFILVGTATIAAGVMLAIAVFAGGVIAATKLPGEMLDRLKGVIPSCEKGSPGLLGAIGGKIPPIKGLTDIQRSNAQIILDVGAKLKVSIHDQTIAIATAMQESNILNVPYGDRDSLGIMQQRPSQGWGTASEVMDIAYASKKFYTVLSAIKNRDKMTLIQAAMAVQRPNPEAYRSRWKWDTKAAFLVNSATADSDKATATPVPPEPGTPPTASLSPSPTQPPDKSFGNCLGLSALLPSSADKCDVGTDHGTFQTKKGSSVKICDVRGALVNATIARSIDKMLSDFAKDGIVLTAASSFRSFEEQQRLYAQNCSGGSCSPPTAFPGESEHEQGLAVDWAYQGKTICHPRSAAQCVGNAGFDKLKNNAAKYGMKNFPREAWHWSTTGT